MKKKHYIVFIVLTVIILIVIGINVMLSGLSGMGNPTGGRGPDYPYYITTKPTMVKNILVPKGTKLQYEEHFFKEGQQDELMNEKKLTMIAFSENSPVEWGGVPVSMIVKFFNSEMRGYTVYADFNHLTDDKITKFSTLWKSADNQLGVDVTNIEDWSFNKENITDVQSCGVNNQRYFKESQEQQLFLDNLYKELKEVK